MDVGKSESHGVRDLPIHFFYAFKQGCVHLVTQVMVQVGLSHVTDGLSHNRFSGCVVGDSLARVRYLLGLALCLKECRVIWLLFSFLI